MCICSATRRNRFGRYSDKKKVVPAECLVYAAKDARENTVHTPWLSVLDKVQVTKREDQFQGVLSKIFPHTQAGQTNPISELKKGER